MQFKLFWGLETFIKQYKNLSNTIKDSNKFKNRMNPMKFVLIIGMLFFCAVIISGAVSAAGLANTPQPKYQHDNYNSGQSTYKGPNTNVTKWIYHTGKGIYSSPAIDSKGVIYFGSADGNLYALNSKGVKLWNFTTSGEVSTTPAIDDEGVLYFGSSDFYALYPNGTEKWKFPVGNYIISSAAIDNETGNIYFGSYDGYLYALSPTGTLLWKFDTGRPVLSSPAIGSDGTIYLYGDYKDPSETNYGALYAINPTGTEKWKFLTEYCLSSPCIGSDGTIYIASQYTDFTVYEQYGVLYAVNPSGTQNWNYTMSLNNMITSSPAIASDGTIYIGTDEGIYALKSDGTKKWSYSVPDLISSTETIGSDGTIYFGTQLNKLFAMNPDGTVKWTYSVNEKEIYNSPSIAADGTIYFGGWNGNLYALSDDKIPPTVSKVDPLNNTVKVAANKIIKITFSEPFKKGTAFTGITLKTSSGSSIPISLSINGSVLSISHGNLMKGVKYILTLPVNSISDLYDNGLAVYNTVFTVEKIIPTVTATPIGGYYKTSKYVRLKMNEPGTIYYTLNGAAPTIKSSKYTRPLIISSTKTLRFFAVDLAGNISLPHIQKYIIDKTSPSVLSTSPNNLKTGVSRTGIITIKFSEPIKSSVNYTKITIINMKTGQKTAVTKQISGSSLYLKTGKRSSGTWYKVIIPSYAVKDYVGNYLKATYSFRFKTGK